jgi:hypothetical protein
MMKNYLAVLAMGLLVAVVPVHAQLSGAAATVLSATTVPEDQLMQPEALNKILLEKNSSEPLILQVGSHVMFEQAHIPLSVYAGPGSQAAGLELLAKAVRSTPKGRMIVIYCGCCPWNHCPNIGPAYKKLHDLGFTNVKALYIARNFGDDWVAKGYPVAKGE